MPSLVEVKQYLPTGALHVFPSLLFKFSQVIFYEIKRHHLCVIYQSRHVRTQVY